MGRTAGRSAPGRPGGRRGCRPQPAGGHPDDRRGAAGAGLGRCGELRNRGRPVVPEQLDRVAIELNRLSGAGPAGPESHTAHPRHEPWALHDGCGTARLRAASTAGISWACPKSGSPTLTSDATKSVCAWKGIRLVAEHPTTPDCDVALDTTPSVSGSRASRGRLTCRSFRPTLGDLHHYCPFSLGPKAVGSCRGRRDRVQPSRACQPRCSLCGTPLNP